MNKKVTRRVVLGAVVSALAVFPFVMRTFRNPRGLNLPLSEYELEWNKFNALTEAKIEKSKGPSVFHLANKATDKKIQYVKLGSFYEDPQLPPLASGIPSFSPVMLLGEYWNEVRNSNLYLLASLSQNECASVASTMTNTNGVGDCVYRITENSVTPGIFEGEEFRPDTNLWSQSRYAVSLYFPFCGEVNIGKSYVVPVKPCVRFKTTFKSAGFFRIEGIETAKFTFTKLRDDGGEDDGTVYVDMNTNLIVREEGNAWHKGDEGRASCALQTHYV